MIYKAVIFDLDGVLCHTDEFHYKSWREIASDFGVDFDMQTNNLLRGVGRMESLEIILNTFNIELTEEEKKHYAKKKNGLYLEMLKDMSPNDIEEDVWKTLNAIRSCGVKMAIGSSSRNAKTILEKTGMEDYFDAVSDGTNISAPKPDPEVFLKASEFLGVGPDKCIVVEDAKSGLEAAINAGMACAAVGKAAGYGIATYDLNKLSDLLKYL